MARPVSEICSLILERFRIQEYAQAPGLNKFTYISDSSKEIIVRRENGNDVSVPMTRLQIAIRAVREDDEVFDGGPGRLRRHGITHINSPIYALIHLATHDELVA